jgi:hypothetical protein
MVDGVSGHRLVIDLAMDRQPDVPFRRGRCKVAAKFMVRMYEHAGRDGRIMRVPHIDEINRLMQRFPDVRVRLKVAEGMPLSQLHFQDSYSHELAEVFVGGDDEDEFVRIYQECLRMLPFMIEERAKAV